MYEIPEADKLKIKTLEAEVLNAQVRAARANEQLQALAQSLFERLNVPRGTYALDIEKMEFVERRKGENNGSF